MDYNENWDALSNILYENGAPRKKIGKEHFETLINQVETIEEGFVRAYLGNNQDVMADLVEQGIFVLNFFTDTLTPEKKAYLKIGELRGYISFMARILSTMVKRDQALHRFNELQKCSLYAKDIILCIGYSRIEEQELIEKLKKDKTIIVKSSITYLIQYGFLYEQKFGSLHILYLSDLGRRVYNHFSSNKEKEIFYRH